ncbi:MAG: AAA family ATPase [Candidatus Hydrothermae bacterium]|nr:AAA family ATPase [Candidatus Hydrothermae bacterium]
MRCPKCGFENPEGFQYCGRCGYKLGTGKRRERKRVTVMFVDVAGFTSLSERRDSEEVAEILNQFFSNVEEIVTKYNGFIDKYIGDAALCLFGAKGQYENHAEKAIMAALEIIKFLKSGSLPVKIGAHIGIHSGEILITGIGVDKTLDYTVLGDTVNLAQRIESHAGFNEILTSETTRNLAENAFEFEALGGIKFKGKSSKIHVYRVKGFSEGRIVRYKFPFVGRKNIIQKLEQEINSNRGTKLLILEGEAGVGKTRVLHEIFLMFRTSYHILYFRAMPFGGSLNILRKEERKKYEPREQPYTEKWLRFVSDIEKGGPAILIFDDMQWADSLSFELIKFLIEKIEIPAYFIISTRDKKIAVRRLGNIKFKTIKITPYTYDEYREFLTKAGMNLPVSVEEEIFMKTKGNPLFIDEIIKTRGEIITDKIEAIIAAEVENLEENLREKLKMLAVLGPSFEISSLELIGIKIDEIKELIELGYIVKEGENLSFKTQLLQDTIYNMLPKDERSQIHSEIYKSMRKSRTLNALYHAFKALELEEITKNWKEFLGYICATGSISDIKIATDFIIESFKALNKNVPDEVLYQNARALIYLGFHDEATSIIDHLNKKQVEYYELLSLYYRVKDQRRKSIEILYKGLTSVNKDRAQETKLYIILSETLLDSGEFRKGIRILKKIEKNLDILNEQEKLRFMNLYQTALENVGEYSKSLKLCESLYKRKILSLSDRANLEFSIAVDKFMLGDLEEAEKWFKTSINTYTFLREYSSLPLVLNEYAYLLYSKGEYDAALGKLEDALWYARKTGDLEEIAKSNAYKGIIYLALGEIGKSETLFRKALNVMDPQKIHKAIYTTILHNYATVFLYKRKFAEAITYFTQVIEMSKKERDAFSENLNLYSLALAHFLSGNLEKALENIRKPLKYSKEEKLPILRFRALSLLYKIETLRGNECQEIYPELLEIAKSVKREDLIALCKFYKMLSDLKHGFTTTKEVKTTLQSIKPLQTYSSFLLEKYSLDLFEKAIQSG